MSRGQHRQANRHGKRTTRGERMLAKLGLKFQTVGLKRFARELKGVVPLTPINPGSQQPPPRP